MNDNPEPLDRPRRRRRGIYLLPNLITTLTLFFGFYAVVAALSGAYELAAIAVLVAMIMDGLDGRVARLTGTQSDFGVQYDSIADMVSFGVAPALVVYAWALADLGDLGTVWGKLGWLGAFIFTACAGLRLARSTPRPVWRTSATSRGCQAPQPPPCWPDWYGPGTGWILPAGRWVFPP